MKLVKISVTIAILFFMLFPMSIAWANGEAPDLPGDRNGDLGNGDNGNGGANGDGGGGDLGPFPDPDPSNPVVNKVSSAGTTPPWCVSKLCFNPSYFLGGGELTLEQDGDTVKISITGNVVTNGQLSLPLPQGADPNKCTFFLGEFAQPNTVFPGNDGNVFAYIGQPPESISGTWSVKCDN